MRAGFVHAHHPPRRIQDRHQCGNRVQCGSHKAALDGQRPLRPLSQSLRLLLQANPAVQLQPRHHLPSQSFQQGQMLRLESVRRARQHRQRANDLHVTGKQRNSGIGKAGIGVGQRYAGGREAWILAGIRDEQRLALLHHPLAGRGRARLVARTESVERPEPKPVVVHPAQVGVVGIAQHCGKLGQLVQPGVGVAIEHT